jgi:putative GTP pyrophosphokinase
MAFAPVPSESRSRIRWAGDVLIAQIASVRDVELAKDMANRWRACHAYPINTFQATLRDRVKKLGLDRSGTIVVQRLKRMPTIIDKLRRYPQMNLTTMQDIGGVRAIVRNVDDVERLVEQYREGGRLAHEEIRYDDYIACPRDEDGYRSAHLVYRYRNVRATEYNGLRIELQIRTKLQHTWATAVESMGTFLGQALKSRSGDQQWLDFFAMVSAAFAHREGCPPVPRFSALSREEIAEAISDAEMRLDAINRMGALTAAVQIIDRELAEKKWAYHLIALRSAVNQVKLTAYGRDGLDQALADYADLEKWAEDGEPIEPVLVSAGRLNTLKRAYPNFFLDIRVFVRLLKEIIQSVRR